MDANLNTIEQDRPANTSSSDPSKVAENTPAAPVSTDVAPDTDTLAVEVAHHRGIFAEFLQHLLNTSGTIHPPTVREMLNRLMGENN